MTITIDLPPEREQKLKDLAESAGVDVSHYIQDILIKHLPAGLPEPKDEWERWLIEFSQRHPVVERHLTDEDLSRENIYEDRA